MTFFKTLIADRVQAIWAKFDIFLIAEFKEANPSLSESELDEAIKDGKLTLAHQESLDLDSLNEMEQRAKIKELEEYLVTKFGSVADVAEFEAWKAAN
jgi:hypothetical protein